jgi:hypothetical protein
MKKILLTLSFFVAIFLHTIDAQTHDFVFTKTAANPNFQYEGQSLIVEGALIAENENHSNDGKNLYFATQREAFNDILITSLTLNKEGEVEQALFTYINKEQSEDLDFGVLTTDDQLDISINYDPFVTETIAHFLPEKVDGKLDGILIAKFKSKKELEDFKLFIRRK